MAPATIEDKVDVRAGEQAKARVDLSDFPAADEDNDLLVELGIWLSGIESFLARGHHTFAEDGKTRLEHSKDIRLLHAALQSGIL